MSLEMEGGSAVLIWGSLGLLILEVAHQESCLSGTRTRNEPRGKVKGCHAGKASAWQDCKVATC